MKPLDAFNPKPVTLRGAHVILEPLEARHAAALFEVGGDEAIWRYLPRPPLASVSDSREMVADALESSADGTQLPFAIVDRSSGKAVGSTRYLDIRRAHRALEVGWTWLGTRYQRTAVNTESKYLLLSHAFEELGAGRVQFQTDGRNVRSQNAIVRLGAKLEGVLRKDKIVRDGHVRDSVIYSVVDSEWPTVKAQLRHLMTARTVPV